MKSENNLIESHKDNLHWLRTVNGFQLDVEALKVVVVQVLMSHCPQSEEERSRIFGTKIRVVVEVSFFCRFVDFDSDSGSTILSRLADAMAANAASLPCSAAADRRAES